MIHTIQQQQGTLIHQRNSTMKNQIILIQLFSQIQIVYPYSGLGKCRSLKILRITEQDWRQISSEQEDLDAFRFWRELEEIHLGGSIQATKLVNRIWHFKEIWPKLRILKNKQQYNEFIPDIQQLPNIEDIDLSTYHNKNIDFIALGKAAKQRYFKAKVYPENVTNLMNAIKHAPNVHFHFDNAQTLLKNNPLDMLIKFIF